MNNIDDISVEDLIEEIEILKFLAENEEKKELTFIYEAPCNEEADGPVSEFNDVEDGDEIILLENIIIVDSKERNFIPVAPRKIIEKHSNNEMSEFEKRKLERMNLV